MQSTNAKFQKGIALEKIRSDQTFSVTTRFNCTSKLAQKNIICSRSYLYHKDCEILTISACADRIYFVGTCRSDFQIKVRTTSKVILNIKRI